MISENESKQLDGWPSLIVIILLILLSAYGIVMGIIRADQGMPGAPGLIIFSTLALGFLIFCTKGFYTVEPNEAAVLLLFGKYKGTDKVSGFRFTNPLYTRRKISLRVRNFDSEKLKVNDKRGNPIEISAVVVWRVKDTAQAVFEVDDFIDYVKVQSESAIRHLATSYPYDQTEGEEVSLRSSLSEISDALREEIQDRVRTAGVVVDEARINHLAYAPEIAGAMLQRQQAEAVIAARQKIVDGAVGMVQMALVRLKEEGVLTLDEERKASMVSNLMVVLCADKATQPIINTGSLY